MTLDLYNVKENKRKSNTFIYRPIKLALFSDYFHDRESYGGGVGVVTANLAFRFKKFCQKVYVFTTNNKRKRKIKYAGRLCIIKYPSILRAVQTYISLDLLVKPLKYDVDIIHIEGGIIASLSGLLYSLIRKRPLVITVHHTGDTWKSLIKNIIARLYEYTIFHIVLKRACKIIIPSKYLLYQSRHLAKLKSKIVEIPNGVDIDSEILKLSKEKARRILKLPLDTKIVLFVGALCRRKGVDTLIMAAKKVIKAFPNVLFILVGIETEETSFLKKQIKDMGLKKYVRLQGYVSDAIKKLYYRSADLFVLPSRSEGFGIVILEAFANALPVIVSDLPVFKETVKEGFNGLIAKKEDPLDLADKILYLLTNDTIRKRMARNAIITINRFSWDSIAMQTLKVYSDVLSSRIKMELYNKN